MSAKTCTRAEFEAVRHLVELDNPLFSREMDKVQRGITRWMPRDIEPVLRLWEAIEPQDGLCYAVPFGALPEAVGGELAPAAAAWLRDYQQTAARRLLAWDCGVVVAPCGAGKTAIGIGVLQSMGPASRALVLVHTSDLQRQWVARVGAVGLRAVGPTGAAKLGEALRDREATVVVATVQSLRLVPTVSTYFGTVMVDECHHVPSRTFTDLLPRLSFGRVYGLTATPVRKDGMHVVMPAMLGPVRYEVSRDMLTRTGATLVPQVVRVDTGAYCMSSEYGQMIAELAEQRGRNAIIASKVRRFRDNCLLPQLVLTSLVQHTVLLAETLNGLRVRIITGESTTKQRGETLAAVATGGVDVLIATQIADEGLDLPMLAAVHFALPARGDARHEETGGIIEQRAGRVCRPWPGKAQAVVYDYVDDDSLLLSQWRSRQKVYRRLGWPVGGGA
jgi:superfamily II DNA or RNA helicase